MPRVKIKQLDERVATAGLHMGGGSERRKLQPGEVVDIPEDMTLPDGHNLLDLLWNTGKLELTMDPVTRPIDFADYREATLCAPTFKPRGPAEAEERDRALAVVAERMGVSDEPDDPVDEPETAKESPSGSRNRRAERRAAMRAADGAEVST